MNLETLMTKIEIKLLIDSELTEKKIKKIIILENCRLDSFKSLTGQKSKLKLFIRDIKMPEITVNGTSKFLNFINLFEEMFEEASLNSSAGRAKD